MALQFFEKGMHAARYWLLRNLPTCKQVAPLMSASLERALTLRERVTLKLHLWVCVWCVYYLEQLQLMRNVLRARETQIIEQESFAAPSLSIEARERIKDALKHRAV